MIVYYNNVVNIIMILHYFRNRSIIQQYYGYSLMPRPRKRILTDVVSSPGSTQVCFSACNTEKLGGSGLERRLTNVYNRL